MTLQMEIQKAEDTFNRKVAAGEDDGFEDVEEEWEAPSGRRAR